MSSTVDQAVDAASDERRQRLLDRLTAELGDAVVASHLQVGVDVWVRLRPDAWQVAGTTARDALDLRYFCFLSAIDWLPSPFGRGEDDPTQPVPERSTEIVPGITGGATRFQVFARLYDPFRHVGLTMKVDVPEPELVLPTWTKVYAGANWHERETWEMFGITFAGHPNLTRLYLPKEFEGFPLRKDFPLLARIVKPWPGIVDVEPMPEGMDEGGDE